MKRLIETEEGGFASMLGEKICVYGAIYIYAGKLIGVNKDHIELDEAEIVYETGGMQTESWETSEKLPGVWRIQIASIESWGVSKCS
jgi:hypothetical protein